MKIIARVPPALLSSTLVALLLGGCEPPPPAMPEDASPSASETPEDEGGSSTAPTADAVDQDDLPRAEDVLEAAVAAVGGRQKVASIASYYSESELSMPAQNMSAKSKVWWKNGDFHAETDMSGFGLIKVWRTEEGVWSEDPAQGRRKLEGSEARQAEWENSLVLAADWQRHFTKAETIGRRKVGPRTVVDVKLTAQTGEEVVLGVEESTGLLVEQQYTQHTEMGDMPVTVRVQEWATYDGFKAVKVSEMDMKVLTATTTVTKFEINPQIDDSKLRPPK